MIAWSTFSGYVIGYCGTSCSLDLFLSVGYSLICLVPAARILRTAVRPSSAELTGIFSRLFGGGAFGFAAAAFYAMPRLEMSMRGPSIDSRLMAFFRFTF